MSMSVKFAEQYPVHAATAAIRPLESVGTDTNHWSSLRT